MKTDEERVIKMTMAGVGLAHALIFVLVNEGIIDRDRLSAYFRQIIDDLPENERNDPRSVVIAKIAEEFSQSPPSDQPSRPSWFQGVVEGDNPPDDAR